MNLVELQIQQPDNSASVRAQDSLTRAEQLTITNTASYEAATTELMAIKGKLKEIDNARKSLKKPIDEAAARVQAFFRPPLDFLGKAELLIKRKMVAYQTEQERIRIENQRKADEAARKERERLEARAAKAAEAGKAEKAEELQQVAQSITAPIVQTQAPKVSGIATREVWKFEITNRDLVPDEFYVINEKRIADRVRSLKGDTAIPGVRVWKEDSIAARSA